MHYRDFPAYESFTRHLKLTLSGTHTTLAKYDLLQLEFGTDDGLSYLHIAPLTCSSRGRTDQIPGTKQPDPEGRFKRQAYSPWAVLLTQMPDDASLLACSDHREWNRGRPGWER